MVDWAATGAMLTGIGTLAGAGALVVAAFLGKGAVTDFRDEKQAERELEFAERTLAIGYKLQSAFDTIRSPMSSASDLEQSEKELQETDWFDPLTGEQKRNTIQANVFIQRIRYFEKDFEEALSLIPFVKAYFGPKAGDALESIIQCRRAVSVYAEAYSKNDFSDRAHTDTIQSYIWRGWSLDREDPIRSNIDSAIGVLEAELSPVIRSSVRQLDADSKKPNQNA